MIGAVFCVVLRNLTFSLQICAISRCSSTLICSNIINIRMNADRRAGLDQSGLACSIYSDSPSLRDRRITENNIAMVCHWIRQHMVTCEFAFKNIFVFFFLQAIWELTSGSTARVIMQPRSERESPNRQ